MIIFIAAGAVLGGMDKIMGNQFGLGKKFDDGFLLMGPMALSMTGIICLTPVLSAWLGSVIRPVFSAVGIDPAMFGCILAIDMGGYQLAMDRRGKVLCGAFLVCGASALAAHMGFAAGTQPDLILPLLGGKFSGALLGLGIAMRMTRSEAKQPCEK